MQLQAAMLVDYASVRADQLLYIIGGAAGHVTVDAIPKIVNIGLVVVLDLEDDAGAVLDFSCSSGDDEPRHIHRHHLVWTGEASDAVGTPRLAKLCLSIPVTVERVERHRVTIADATAPTTLATLSFGVAVAS